MRFYNEKHSAYCNSISHVFEGPLQAFGMYYMPWLDQFIVKACEFRSRTKRHQVVRLEICYESFRLEYPIF